MVQEAGVARGTFYQYFDTREAVFRRLIADFVALLNGSVQRITEPTAPMDDLRVNALRVLLQLFAHRELAVLLFRDALTPDPVLQRLQSELHDHMHAMVCGALTKGAQWGVLREVDVDDTAWTIIGAIKELLLRKLDQLPSDAPRHPLPHDPIDTPELLEVASETTTILIDAFYGGLAIR